MTYQKRLTLCMKRGNLRYSDVAHWFDRPHPTVRGWIKFGYKPAGGPQDLAEFERKLTTLETKIKNKDGFPLRMGIKQRKARMLEARP